MATAQEISAAQARTARVRAELGLDSIPPDKWTHAQRIDYNKALAAAILADAQAGAPVSAVDVNKAKLAASANIEQLGEYGLIDKAGDFAGELANQAGDVVESVASVGEGVKSALGFARWLIPLGALAVAVVLFLGFAKDRGVKVGKLNA